MNKLPDWKSLVSSRVGIVNKLEPQFRSAEEPVPPFLYAATLSHYDMRYAAQTARINAGKGPTEEIAKLAAVAEAAERYCAYHLNPHAVFHSTTESLTENKITPEELVLYSDEQYAKPGFFFPKFAIDQTVSWVRGVELPHQTAVALPASLVYLIESVPQILGQYTFTTSNGLAAGSCVESAALGGLCELIERDAFLMTWMNQLPAPEIEIPESGTCGAIKRHYQRIGVSLRTFLLPSDQLPYVVLALAQESDSNRPACAVGLGCELDPAFALEKAVFELCQVRPSSVWRWQNNKPYERLKSPTDVVSLDDHADLYSLQENKKQFEFLWASGDGISLSDLTSHTTEEPEQNLNACVDRLAKTGNRYAYFDLTTPDVLTTGFRVVRSMATSLQPIHFGYGQERLGSSRLFQLPVSLGLLKKSKKPGELNPFPHPLA